MKKNITENLILAINELASTIGTIFSRESLSQKLRQLDKISKTDNSRMSFYLNRLGRQKIIKPLKKNNQIFYSLTSKGKDRINNLLFKRIIELGACDWDGFWRLVIFDIPEETKVAREALRRKLKYFNFYPLQKSVFVFPFECEREIRALADFYELGDCIEIILAKSLGSREESVRQIFNLSAK